MSTITSKPIQISMLGAQAFCEYSLYLVLVKGFTPRPTKEMFAGTQAHAKLNKLAFLTRDSIISIEDALLQAKSDSRETTKRNVIVKGNILHGKIDEIYIGPNEIMIIDDKPRDNVHQSYINQVFGYCLVLKESYNPIQPIYGAVRNLKTGKEIWKELFSASEEQSINSIVERILGIIREDILPIATPFPEKCHQCRFYHYCNFKAR